MHLLVTGATGFVMSVLGREWLAAHTGSQLTVLDVAPLDESAQRYFAPVAGRLHVIVADLTRPESWRAALEAETITHVVHGAAVTPISRGTAGEGEREPEAEQPARILEVNVMGTVALLEWARTQSGIKRFLNVSSGAVYKEHGPDCPGEPLPEDGYVMPRRLYGISKLASELIVERYGNLFGLSTASVRPASVYGTMDRITASRNFRHVPNRIAHSALEGRGPLRVNSLDGVGDYIHVEDVARAVLSLLAAPRLAYSVYNIASGTTSSVSDFVAWAAEKAPGFKAQVVAPGDADLVQDPMLKDGMWGAYDISRIQAETGWHPRPMRQAFHAYMAWLSQPR
jgi:UDP-glucose 4-epimerase